METLHVDVGDEVDYPHGSRDEHDLVLLVADQADDLEKGLDHPRVHQRFCTVVIATQSSNLDFQNLFVVKFFHKHMSYTGNIGSAMGMKKWVEAWQAPDSPTPQISPTGGDYNTQHFLGVIGCF